MKVYGVYIGYFDTLVESYGPELYADESTLDEDLIFTTKEAASKACKEEASKDFAINAMKYCENKKSRGRQWSSFVKPPYINKWDDETMVYEFVRNDAIVTYSVKEINVKED